MKSSAARSGGLAGCLTLAVLSTGCLTPKPKVAPPAGIYSCPATVTMTDPQGKAAIYYTTNGGVPTTAATKYAGPFLVNNDTQVQAMALAPGKKPSGGVSVQYGCKPTVAKADFALSLQQRFNLPPPAKPVAYADLHPGDELYPAAQAIAPYLRRLILCSGCVLSAKFSPYKELTRAQAAVTLVSLLMASEKVQIVSQGEASRILEGVPDAKELPVAARPYIATAIQNEVLTLKAGNQLQGTAVYTREEMQAAFVTMQRKFNLPPATVR